ncbi:2'-5' RNA ligase family protein [Altererythrobacter arenosus]|uniref:2'-5' RNA ligase family protein n=1 Tax=Altererythrobacter arenosus TaxID=3032592 RepID=A0ABY8FTK9_9SPHN|nr:2'-5' RNA ligase family protein [Altererythrobacter sp. CAU 1644]WFL77435.1 2'-5' RNA ligase family protein [Altererythrobacter sp. CAU 1644]
MKNPPFIVTASLPPDLFAWADRLRREHFPPERNHLHAHVTLFHSFAPTLFEELKTVLPRVAGEFAPVPARIEGLMDLGKGTAIRIESPGMLAIRAGIAEHFHGALTDQDLHEPRLHITVQNKVTKEEARALQAELASVVEQREFHFTGLELHRYLGGPWEMVRNFPFRGREKA